jgi:hypothetical protein
MLCGDSNKGGIVMKRFLTNWGCVAVLFFGTMLIASPALAQQETQTYYTYVSQWTVPRDQWNAFDKQEASDIPGMQKLVSDGTLVDWGNLSTRVHSADGYTHAEFFTATSRANLLKALEHAWSTATNTSFVAATKHEDLLLRTLAHGGKTVSNATGYLLVGFYQTKHGDEQAFENLLLKDVKSFLDSDISNGTLLAYNLDTEDIHTSAPGSYNIALLFPEGASIDKFYEELSAAQKTDPAVGRMFNALTVDQDHRDSLSRVTAFQHK